MRNSKYKKELLIFFGILLIIGLVIATLSSRDDVGNPDEGYKNATYIIDGQPVTLEDGFSEIKSAPDSASSIITSYFGSELVTDLNDDGRDDVVFILTQQTGGSGTFFYVVAAIKTGDGYAGSEAYPLGDRIAPQTTELSRNPNHQNVIIVNYTDRASDEPMVATPSVGKSVWLKLDPRVMQFGIVEQNFEGEADPSRMSLTMNDWTWVSALYSSGQSVAQNQFGDFVITFNEDGTFHAKTDCNSMSGDYTAHDGSLSFGSIAMTKMFCADSKENEFLKILETTTKYMFSSKGELILELKFGNGTATFQILDTNKSEQKSFDAIEPFRASLSGEYVCLPHKDTTGPQTLECMYGIKVDNGEYYGIDFYLMSQTHSPVEIGQKISANGVVQLAERLISNHWQKYSIEGVFSVTDSLKIIE